LRIINFHTLAAPKNTPISHPTIHLQTLAPENRGLPAPRFSGHDNSKQITSCHAHVKGKKERTTINNAPAPQSQNFGRCRYLTAAKRRCRSHILERDGAYCPLHQDKQHGPGDFAMNLTHHSLDFRNARGISSSLRDLYFLLASNRISPRRASTLAYISSLMLRSIRDIQPDPVHNLKICVYPQNAAEIEKILNSINPNAPYDEALANAQKLAQQFPPPEPSHESQTTETPNFTEQEAEALSTQKPN
jgi:hypothetical protein